VFLYLSPACYAVELVGWPLAVYVCECAHTHVCVYVFLCIYNYMYVCTYIHHNQNDINKVCMHVYKYLLHTCDVYEYLLHMLRVQNLLHTCHLYTYVLHTCGVYNV